MQVAGYQQLPAKRGAMCLWQGGGENKCVTCEAGRGTGDGGHHFDSKEDGLQTVVVAVEASWQGGSALPQKTFRRRAINVSSDKEGDGRRLPLNLCSQPARGVSCRHGRT